MSKKSFIYFVSLILLIISLAIWSVFTAIDRNSLRGSINETSTFIKARITNYNNTVSNDRVKSLVRLVDKSLALRDDLGSNNFDIDDYIDQQRLTGVIILDSNLNITYKSNDEAYDLWSDLINTNYVKDIIEFKNKTYSERVTIADKTYDFACISYNDGLLISYVLKDENAVGDLTLANLFVGFPFEKNGIVVISDGENVVSTNSTDLMNKTLEECVQNYNNEFEEDDDGIVYLTSNKGSYYGIRDNIENYDLYIFFPSKQVFLNRNTIEVFYTGIAIVFLLVVIISENKKEQKDLLKDRRYLDTIKALATSYSSISLIDLKNNEVEIVKSSLLVDPDIKKDIYKRDMQIEHIQKIFAKESQEEYIAFTDMSTINERLKDIDYVSIDSKTNDNRWLYSIIICQARDKDGNVIAVLIANRDITDEKKREMEQDRALRLALVNAESANKAKTSFLNSVSHDIRTPMNAIIGFTALATTHIDSKELVKDYLNKISISGQHLLSLINDVLDMSRIESGVVKLDEKDVHLPDVLHDLRAIIQGSIHSKQQELYIDTQDVVHEDIITDKLRLNQVLINIASNATKFTPVGGTISIKVIERPCLKEGYASYTFKIKDNGVGMSKEYVDKIFDPFSREKSSTKSGIQGTGLGMAISKNIIDMMNGKISVNSSKGQGSEFVVEVDFKLSNKVITYKPISDLKMAKALVVDDDAQTCVNVSKLLKEIEMLPEWTTSPNEAILKAKEAYDENNAFKVFIIDWLMPDMNGIELVRRIRKVIDKDTPIIILSAYDWADIEQEAKEAGVTAFISKPIFMSELRNVLTLQVEDKIVNKENRRHEGKKVLLVEDNGLNSEIASAMLKDVGMLVDCVKDGSDAVEVMVKASDDQYDVIFMDVQMPKMDGYSATKQIRTLPNNKIANIPIIAMSANAFEEDKRKAALAGMNGYVSKPVDINAILNALDKVFN